MRTTVRTSLAGRTAVAIVSAVLLGVGSMQAQMITNVFDDFNRADGDSLGTTSVGGFVWNENESSVPARISLVGNTAQFNSRGSGSDPGATLSYSANYVDISVTLNGFHTASDNFFGGLMYRLGSTNSLFADGTAGYRVRFDTGGFIPPSPFPADTISLLWGNTVLAQYTSPTPFVSGQDYRLRAIASGQGQTVFLDGARIIDFIDSDLSHNVSGFVGLGSYYGNYKFDDFLVAVPEPSAALLACLGLAGWICRKRCQ